MTMSLLPYTSQDLSSSNLSSQGLRGALTTLSGATPSPGASEGFQTALRQAFDTRAGTSLTSDPLQASQAPVQEHFRAALAALGVEPDTLDETDASTLSGQPKTLPQGMLADFRDAMSALGVDGEALDETALRQALDTRAAAPLAGQAQSQSQPQGAATLDAFRDALSALGMDAEALDETALRQALDTLAATPSAGQSQPQDPVALDTFREALTALGIDVGTLDDASLSALFNATGQVLAADVPSGQRLESLENMFARLNASASADENPIMAPLTLNTAGTTPLSGPADGVEEQKWADAPLDEVQARLALMAAFAETPAKAAEPGMPETAQLNSATPATFALSEAASQVLNAANALRAEADPTARWATSASGETRPTWSAQGPASLYTAATTLSTAPDGGLTPAPLVARSDAMPAATASLLQTASAPAPSTGAEQAGLGAAPGGAPVATPGSASTAINAPVTSAAFPEKLGQQLIQLTQRGGEQHVKLELHPAELGPLSISLKVSEHGTQAQFFSAHAQVRQVVEQAIPQLREALAAQGISLGETSVGEHGQPNEQAFAQANGASARGGGDAAEGGLEGIDAGLATPVRLTLDGRVDLYA
ncbi:flagellar hook-length control protein FliK [Vreelandella sp. EE7]